MQPGSSRAKKWLAACAGALLLAGCASLPDGDSIRQRPGQFPDQALTMVDGQRLLEPSEVERVLVPRLTAAPSPGKMRRLLQSAELITGNPLVIGNKVELLIDGKQTYAAIFDAIEKAEKHVHIISYIFADDEIGQRLSEILKRKVAEGVEVRLIVDAFGGLFVSEAFYADLREAGVETTKFNPVDPLEDPKLWRINHREHSKLVIVDGQTVFTGGMNISGVYSKRPSRFSSLPDPARIINERAWRDTHVKISGPAGAYFQNRFIQTWNQTSDNKLDDLVEYLPAEFRARDGKAIIRVLESQGGDQKYEIYALYLSAIERAQRRLWLTHAYFAPNQVLLDALKAAARRGVDVRIILPGVLDHGLLYHSSRARYGELLEAGVRICNFQNRMLHAKTMVVDSLWTTIGSANLDFRSFIHNNELNISVLDAGFAGLLERQFRKDLKDCDPVSLEAWQQRPFTDKVKEVFSRSIDYWL